MTQSVKNSSSAPVLRRVNQKFSRWPVTANEVLAKGEIVSVEPEDVGLFVAKLASALKHRVRTREEIIQEEIEYGIFEEWPEPKILVLSSDPSIGDRLSDAAETLERRARHNALRRMVFDVLAIPNEWRSYLTSIPKADPFVKVVVIDASLVVDVSIIRESFRSLWAQGFAVVMIGKVSGADRTLTAQELIGGGR